MRASLLFASLVTVASITAALTFTRDARANDFECPVTQIGQACGNGDTCVDATCCDDPNGCAFDAGSGTSSGGSSGASGSGGATGTGVSRACGVCTFLGAPYCSPSDEGKACADGGVCEGFGGGGEPSLLSLDGGTTNATFSFYSCGTGGFGDDDGGGTGSGGTGFGAGSSGGSSSGGNNGSGGGASSGSSSSGSSSSSSGGEGSSASDAGAGKGTVTAGCAIAPMASRGPRESAWSAMPWLALGLVARMRRKNR